MTNATTDRPAIVLFRPGALGDALLTVDAILALRRLFPNDPIELVGNRDGGCLLARWGIVSRASPFDSSDVTGLFASPPRIVDRWTSARRAVFWMRSPGVAQGFARATSAEVVWAPPEPPPASPAHLADHLVATLEPLAAHAVLPSGEPASEPALLDRWMGSTTRVVVLHPGSGSPRKNWPAERFAAVVTRLASEGRPVVVISGPADDEATRLLREHLGSANRPATFIAPGDITELAATLCSASLYVGNDSGVSHVSGRLGVPTLAIFGTTDPGRWAPRGPRVRAVGSATGWPSVDELLSAAARLERAFGPSRGSPRPHLDEDGAPVKG